MGSPDAAGHRARRPGLSRVLDQPWHVTLAHRHQATTAYSSALVARMRTIAAQELRAAAGVVPVLGGPF